MKKVPSIIFGTLLLAGFSGAEPADATVKTKVPNRPSHEELLAKQTSQRERAMERVDEFIQPGELKKRVPVQKGDIISRSTILSAGKHWTIVPKGAVLHVPTFLAARVNKDKNGTFVSWKNFYAQNRGWIHLQDVKMQQARGKEVLPEGAVEAYPKIGRVVVAVCHGGPISVRKEVVVVKVEARESEQ